MAFDVGWVAKTSICSRPSVSPDYTLYYIGGTERFMLDE